MFEGETDHRNLSYVSPQILCDDFSTNLTILGQVKCRDGFEESMFEATGLQVQGHGSSSRPIEAAGLRFIQGQSYAVVCYSKLC